MGKKKPTDVGAKSQESPPVLEAAEAPSTEALRREIQKTSDIGQQSLESPPVLEAADATSTEALRREIQQIARELFGIRNQLDTVLTNQNTILGRIDKIENKQTQLETSIEFVSNTISKMEIKMKYVTTELKGVSSAVEAEKSKCLLVQNQLNKLERYSRSFNLRFGGLPEEINENTVQKITDLIENELCIPNVKIENAHRSGKPRGPNDKPRHIIAKFIYRPQRHQVLSKSKSSLKSSNIYVFNDLCEADLIKKRSLKDTMAIAYREGKRPSFRNGNLYINGSLHS
ncbi:uncharacterized protein [Antedon mediterranea]|uniref:uncharacterized protein n=1 Tax=Antedon mediterranea TaxID=105859 RepID=UPI003AF8D0D5